MNYREKTIKHLEKHKIETYPDLGDGVYRKKDGYKHILPKEHQEKNFLQIYRENILQSNLYDANKLHIYFSHLNSSQAMCFNFFYPLYHERKLELVLDSLGIKNEKINYSTVCFEKDGKDKCEIKNYRPTSFDFYFETQNEKKFFFEIKYTEAEFGSAKNDISHQEKFNTVYSKFVNALNDDFKTIEAFLKKYQICRNLIHIEENSFVVFVYPEANKKIREGAESAKEIINLNYSNNFKCINWETLFQNINDSIEEKKLKDHFNDFKSKYFHS
ncbi:PGN_0703 family putative restriction endonuclease [Flavobacterium notoginsengisoli]|uniref:PGN_0703 family putative restriction endonuclease n=1 Tax=Flavobacterium notoginsengisoli TaxID=1478199 RepID=UPI003632867F